MPTPFVCFVNLIASSIKEISFAFGDILVLLVFDNTAKVRLATF